MLQIKCDEAARKSQNEYVLEMMCARERDEEARN